MTKKKTFRNSSFKDYVIQVKFINEKWHIFCKHLTQDHYHLCYVKNYYDTWTCITDSKNHDTYRMFDYTVSIYDAEVFGEEGVDLL